MADREKTVRISFVVEVDGLDKVTILADILDRISVSSGKAAAGLKEFSTAATASGNAARSATAAHSGFELILERVKNRIVTGIPTMIALVTAYKLMTAPIEAVTAAIARQDEITKGTVGLAQTINLFSTWKNGAGQAVASTEQFGVSMQFAKAQMEYLHAAATRTTGTVAELVKGLNTIEPSMFAKGISATDATEFTVNLRKISVSEEDFMKKAAGFAQFVKNPTMRPQVRNLLPFVSNEDLRAMSGNTEEIRKTIERMMRELAKQAQEVGDQVPMTFEQMFAKIKESAEVGLVQGMGGALGQTQKQIQALTPYVLGLARTFGEDLAGTLPTIIKLITFLAGVTVLLMGAFEGAYGVLILFNSALLMVASGLEALIAKLPGVSQAVRDDADRTWKAAVEQWNHGLDILGQANEKIKLATTQMQSDGRATDAELAKLKKNMADFEAQRRKMEGITKANEHAKELEKLEKQWESLNNQAERYGAENSVLKKITELNQLGDTFDDFIYNHANQLQYLFGTDLDKGIAKFKETIEKAINYVTAEGMRANSERLVKLFDLGDHFQQELDSKVLDPYRGALEQIDEETRAAARQIQNDLEAALKGSLNEGQKALHRDAADRALAQMYAAKKAEKDLTSQTQQANIALLNSNPWPTITLTIQQAVRAHEDVGEALDGIRDRVLRFSNDASLGYAFAMMDIVRSIKSTAQAMYDFITGVANAFRTTLHDGIVAALTGDKQGLEDLFKNFMKSIANVLADYLTNSIMDGLKNALNGGSSILDAFSSSNGGAGADTTGVTGEGRGVPTGETKNNPWLKNASGIAAGMMGAYAIGSQAANGTLKPGTGAMEGAVAGYGVGGWVGAVVGLVVGALAGLVTMQSAPSPQEVIFGQEHGMAMVRGGFNDTFGPGDMELTKFQQELQSLLDKFVGGFTDILLSVPKAIFDKMVAALDGPIGEPLQRHKNPDGTRTGNLDIQSKNYAKWYEMALQTTVPKEIMEYYKPAIDAGLGALGMSSGKIADLEKMWANMDPTAALESVKKLFVALVQLQDVLEKGGNGTKTLDYFMNQANVTENQGWAASVQPQVDSLLELGAAIGQLSGEAQINAVAKLGTDLGSLFQNFQSYIAKVNSTIKNITKSIDDAIFGIRLDQAPDKGSKAKLLFQHIQDLDVLQQQATTPEQVQMYANEIQTSLMTLYNLDPKAYGSYVISQLTKEKEFARQQLEKMAQEATDAWNNLMASINPVIDDFNNLHEAMNPNDNPPPPSGGDDGGGGGGGGGNGRGPKPGGPRLFSAGGRSSQRSVEPDGPTRRSAEVLDNMLLELRKIRASKSEVDIAIRADDSVIIEVATRVTREILRGSSPSNFDNGSF